jgi:hypothetical protein
VSVQTTVPETEQDGPVLLIHAAGPLGQDALTGILRSAANARAALGQGADIEVVVPGPGVKLLATEAITRAGQLHVDILACSDSMHIPPPASPRCNVAALDGDKLWQELRVTKPEWLWKRLPPGRPTSTNLRLWRLHAVSGTYESPARSPRAVMAHVLGRGHPRRT